jgi:hypothetical protein
MPSVRWITVTRVTGRNRRQVYGEELARTEFADIFVLARMLGKPLPISLDRLLDRH